MSHVVRATLRVAPPRGAIVGCSMAFITTAIDYTNAPPHIGHAYEKILADVLARYQRLRGEPVYFLTGVDQHGQKVQLAAGKEGVEPQAFVDALSEKFIALWSRLEVEYDGWAATTNPLHKECVREILQALHDAGELYQAPYKGFYSERQEQFLTDKERGPDGTFGPEWGHVVELEEVNWYFRLTKYKDWLVDFITNTPGLATPEYRQRELLNAAKKIEGDLSISRPKARLSWGIEMPFGHDYVTYVWFDALVNYISFAGYRQTRDASGQLAPSFPNPPGPGCTWPALHVIGKDILIPAHGIYWLCMLKAMGFADDQMPKLLVHGYVNISGEKMSKSLGNIKDPNEVVDSLAAAVRRGFEKNNEAAAKKGKAPTPEAEIAAFAKRCGPEALRYYLMRDCQVGGDMDFADDRLLSRYEADLANALGNLLNRTLSMAQNPKYLGGILRPPPAGTEEFVFQDQTIQLAKIWRVDALETVRAYTDAMNAHKVNVALEAAFQFATTCNTLIEQAAPFKLAKEETPDRKDQLAAVLYTLAESIRIIAILIAPVLPRAAAEIFTQLNVSGEPKLADAKWGGLADHHHLGQPTPLFPRLEKAAS